MVEFPDRSALAEAGLSGRGPRTAAEVGRVPEEDLLCRSRASQDRQSSSGRTNRTRALHGVRTGTSFANGPNCQVALAGSIHGQGASSRCAPSGQPTIGETAATSPPRLVRRPRTMSGLSDRITLTVQIGDRHRFTVITSGSVIGLVRSKVPRRHGYKTVSRLAFRSCSPIPASQLWRCGTNENTRRAPARVRLEEQRSVLMGAEAIQAVDPCHKLVPLRRGWRVACHCTSGQRCRTGQPSDGLARERPLARE